MYGKSVMKYFVLLFQEFVLLVGPNSEFSQTCLLIVG